MLMQTLPGMILGRRVVSAEAPTLDETDLSLK
jgi:hypothetical protein